jgi:hypothetical protein
MLPDRHSDPFCNMMTKGHTSPVLKPVFAKPKKYLINSSRSEDNIISTKYLPPLSSRYRNIIDFSIINRNTLKTPNFSISDKIFNKKVEETQDFEVSFGSNQTGCFRN